MRPTARINVSLVVIFDSHPHAALFSALGTLCLAASVGCVVTSNDEVETAAGSTGASSTSDDESGPETSASTSGDATGATGDSGTTAGSTTNASSTQGTTGDSGPDSATDSTASSVSAGSDTTTDSGGSEGGGTVDVVLTGCNVDFGGTIVVSYNGSLGVASIYDNGATLSGSFQFDLDGVGAMTLSSQHRVDTGNVINLVDVGQGTWTNLDSDALSGGTDSISGTLTVTTWNPSAGESLIEFDGVSLQNVVDLSVCTIDGTITTTELYP